MFGRQTVPQHRLSSTFLSRFFGSVFLYTELPQGKEQKIVQHVEKTVQMEGGRVESQGPVIVIFIANVNVNVFVFESARAVTGT